MRAEPGGRRAWAAPAAVALAAALGLGLMAGSLSRTSATYDEVAYLRVACRWWRTGEQESITRMGSPLTFWKLQQAPALWALDRLGMGTLLDDPLCHQSLLLPLVRAGALAVWVAALVVTALWARRLYGPRAMAMAALLFALSPNLLAHGALVTMELPLVAATALGFFLFWRFLALGDRRMFWASAAAAGLAFSCKFTAVLYPPVLALAWWLQRRSPGVRGRLADALVVARGMSGFLAVMGLADLAVTGFATLPTSPRTGDHPSLAGLGAWAGRLAEVPIPQDWVAFLTQLRHQRSGGPSYLLGERRMTGWWYYYFVALAVKVPLGFWLIAAARARLGRSVRSAGAEGLIPWTIAAVLALCALGSSRNYGVRYLLPLAPLAIVWASALAEGPRWARRAAVAGLLLQGAAVASVHPFELSYFNLLAGGPAGGKYVLADSNLDWGQGARELARLQQREPRFRDLTLYYFGDTDPGAYGVVGRRFVVDASDAQPGLPPEPTAATRFIGVSTSLQFGPWGPPGYFRALDGARPVHVLDDQTIAIYRADDLNRRARREARGHRIAREPPAR